MRQEVRLTTIVFSNLTVLRRGYCTALPSSSSCHHHELLRYDIYELLSRRSEATRLRVLVCDGCPAPAPYKSRHLGRRLQHWQQQRQQRQRHAEQHHPELRAPQRQRLHHPPRQRSRACTTLRVPRALASQAERGVPGEGGDALRLGEVQVVE